MVKKYIITFSISVLVLFSICIIMLMIMVPQQQVSLTGTVKEYEKINSTEYKFDQTKDISEATLVKQYTISSDQLSTFKSANQYLAGNSDPFTPASDLTSSASSNTQTSTNTSTTNSNGGISNPTSTTK